MDIATLIPSPDAIPAPWLWLQIFLTATTFLHLVAMNLVRGSGFIALITPTGTAGGGVDWRRNVGLTPPFTIAATITLGVK